MTQSDVRVTFPVYIKMPESGLAWLSLTLAISPYLYLAFLNVDPLHDGWFSTPAVALAEGGVPYRDVVTSYGWVTPAFLGIIIKIFGFQLLYSRLIGLFFLIGICILFIVLLKKSIGLNKSLAVVSIWLLIGLGQMTKDPQALPSWGLWPNQLIILGSLVLIYLLLCTAKLSYSTLALIGIIAGLAPWVRAQGVLILASALFVFTIRIHQSSSPNKFLRMLQLFSVTFIAFLAPLLYLFRTDAIDEWFWQTIEMPRTGEWIGMPNPAGWLIQNFGLAILLTSALFIVSNVLNILKVSGKKLTILLIPVLILISIFPISKAPLEGFIVIRKVYSLLYLYSNYYFFTLPVLVIFSATLFLGLGILKKVLLTRGRFLFEMPSLVALLGIPALTLVYYNFSHLWGVAPLLLLSILYYWKPKVDFFSRFGHFRQVIIVYSILVALIAIPQVYLNLAKPTFSYSISGLSGMRGQNNQQVVTVRDSMQKLSQLPEKSMVFFLCRNAFYATIEGRYLSDNLFYSSVMTSFDKRSLSYRVPSAKTNFVVYCPESSTVEISELPGSWVLSDFMNNDSESSLQIYERK
jgi:hypothetical protein